MNMLDIDWVGMRASFLVVVGIASLPCLFFLGAVLDEPADRFYRYLDRMIKRYDERTARRTR